MLLNLIRSQGDIGTKIATALFSIIIVVFSLTIHEVSHGLAALALGDPTAKQRGRLTLNPLKHLNPLGTVMMLFFGFGYAEPVPINPNYFKHRKTGMAITAFAGPLSNLILSFIAAIGLVSITNASHSIVLHDGSIYYAQSATGILMIIFMFFYYMHMMNLYLAIFNLIPVPPLDGSRILFIFLPAEKYFAVMKYERYIMLGLIALIYVGVLDGPLRFITTSISSGMMNLIDLVI